MEEARHMAAADDVEGSNIVQKQILETDDEKKTRLLSLRIIYFTMFLMTLGFSIILTGIWPYLDKVRFVTDHLNLFFFICRIISA